MGMWFTNSIVPMLILLQVLLLANLQLLLSSPTLNRHQCFAATLRTNKMLAQLLRMVLSSTQTFVVPSRQDASCHLYRPLVTVSIMPHM